MNDLHPQGGAIVKRTGNQRKLSRAIQNCIIDIVDEMPFNLSEIPDILIQDGCITEDECNEIREKANRKDQVRKLVLLIKGRSFEIMQKYLDAIKIHCPAAVEKVWNQYITYMKDKTRQRNCPFCELKEYVDLKYVSDFLYGKEVISTGLYTQICDGINSTSQQDALWDLTIKACSGRNMKYLREVLQRKGHYTHIAESVRMFHDCRSYNYTCACSIKKDMLDTYNASGDENGSSTTYSPQSSPRTFSSDVENTTPKSKSIEITDVTLLGSELSNQSSTSSEQTVIGPNLVEEVNNYDADDRLRVVENQVQENLVHKNLNHESSNVIFGFNFLCIRCCKRHEYELEPEEVFAISTPVSCNDLTSVSNNDLTRLTVTYSKTVTSKLNLRLAYSN